MFFCGFLCNIIRGKRFSFLYCFVILLYLISSSFHPRSLLVTISANATELKTEKMTRLQHRLSRWCKILRIVAWEKTFIQIVNIRRPRSALAEINKDLDVKDPARTEMENLEKRI